MPSFQDLEDAITTLEDYVASQIPIITRSLQRLTDDLRRFGPPEMPEIPAIPIPIFASIPPPPPPPPPQPTAALNGPLSKIWCARKSVLVGLVGVGLVTGGWMYWSSKRIQEARAMSGTKSAKEVVVVLGADSPLGHILVSELRAKDCIVIASVSTPEAISELERIGKGFVKALILNPADPTSTTPFLRSLQSTLSLKFPIAPGDPYAPAPLAELPTLVSLISLLSLAPPDPHATISTNDVDSTASITSASSAETTVAPTISNVSISKDYLPHLVATHLTPFSIIQSILPLFKSSQKKGLRHPSIIVALRGGPAGSVGIAGPDAVTAMSNAAMAKGCEILRREVALTPDISGTRVIVVDVGELALRPRPSKSPRKPTDPRHFTDAVLGIVCRHRYLSGTAVGLYEYASFAAASMQCWWRGDRFSIGAGAGTYAFANRLPLWVLDTVVLLPRRLLAYRDWVQRKTRAIRHEVAKERRKRKEREREQRAQQEAEADEGKAMVVVPRQKASRPPSVASAEEHADESVVDSASEPDTHSDNGSAASSGVPSEAGEHIGESWVMDVEHNGVSHQSEETVTDQA